MADTLTATHLLATCSRCGLECGEVEHSDWDDGPSEPINATCPTRVYYLVSACCGEPIDREE